MKQKRSLYLAAACALAALVTITSLVTKRMDHTLKMLLISDRGVTLNHFFDGVTETDARIVRLNSRWTALNNWAKVRADKVTIPATPMPRRSMPKA